MSETASPCPLHPAEPGRGVYCNRTLNMRSIKAIGYDMDYTLIHYDIEAWEARAFEALAKNLQRQGWPTEGLEFSPNRYIRGLVIDRQLGNIVKPNRFGYVKRAVHGTRLLTHDEQRAAYGMAVVDLAEPRWAFMNTFFSISEACMFAHLVDLVDDGALPAGIGYPDLYPKVRQALDHAHMEGQLKAEITSNPDRYVQLDPDIALSLQEQKAAGKKVILITNSEWEYTRAIMNHAVAPFVKDGSWRDLFDIAIVSARKPAFFTARPPAFELVDEDRGLFRPAPGHLEAGKVYSGGNADLLETTLGIQGSSFLYVGDHIYADVHVSKGIRRWRTALIVRELEGDVAAEKRFAEGQTLLNQRMNEKQQLEHRLAHLKLERTRQKRDNKARQAVQRDIETLKAQLNDEEDIIGLARQAGSLGNKEWGLLMRTGNDKSHLARQVERHADIYTSRASNLRYVTPYAFIRSHRGSLPHDEDAVVSDD